MRVLIGVTGASGSAYARRMLQVLCGLGVEVHCAISATGRITWKWELGSDFDDDVKGLPGLALYGEGDMMSPMASGSFKTDGMAVVPCSMRTLGSVAGGLAGNLIQRAAEVCLKERRKLVLVVRESPYSLGHLENMTRVTHAGAVVLPASPGFYHRPRSLDDMVDFIVSRTLDHLGIPNDLIRRWGSQTQEVDPDGRRDG